MGLNATNDERIDLYLYSFYASKKYTLSYGATVRQRPKYNLFV